MPEESTDRSYEYNVQVKDNHGEWKTYGGWSWTTRGDFTMELLDSPEDAIWTKDLEMAKEWAESTAADDVRIIRRLVSKPEVVE